MDNVGEHDSVGDELLNGVPEIELKCKAVLKSVKERYFTLEEALSNYEVKEEEYKKFLNQQITKT